MEHAIIQYLEPGEKPSYDHIRSDDVDIFQEHIHRLQDLLALRVVRRDYPAGWR